MLVSMKRDGRTLAHNTLEEMRVLAVQRMGIVNLLSHSGNRGQFEA